MSDGPALAELQRRFFELVTGPQRIAEELARRGIPEPELAALIAGDARASAVERLDVYANMYFFRILEVANQPGRISEKDCRLRLIGREEIHRAEQGRRERARRRGIENGRRTPRTGRLKSRLHGLDRDLELGEDETASVQRIEPRDRSRGIQGSIRAGRNHD